jgi:hypothetical protein
VGATTKDSQNNEWVTPKTRKVIPPPMIQPKDPDNDTNVIASSENDAYASVIDVTEATGKSYSDTTGRFPVKSDRGNLYVLVLYVHDDNAILVEPMKNRSDVEQIRAYTVLLERAQKGATLSMHWMDNEASKAVKTLITQRFQLDYQLVPPHNHRKNAAERAIRTFKNHFIAGLSAANDGFPMRLWDRL